MTFSSDLRLISAMARGLATKLENVPVRGTISMDTSIEIADLITLVRSFDFRLNAIEIEARPLDRLDFDVTGSNTPVTVRLDALGSVQTRSPKADVGEWDPPQGCGRNMLDL